NPGPGTRVRRSDTAAVGAHGPGSGPSRFPVGPEPQAACPAPGSNPEPRCRQDPRTGRSPSRQRFGSTPPPQSPPGAKPIPSLIPSRSNTRPVIPCPTPHPQSFDGPIGWGQQETKNETTIGN